MEHYVVPRQGLDVPAWFGKLPGMGDFAQRRMVPGFLEVWDRWLQHGLQQMRAQRDDWLAYYLEAPLWCFALGRGVVGIKPWIGVLMPSVDSVGRYFPLTLAIELEHDAQAAADDPMAGMRHWWARSAQAALSALDADLDATGFDAALQHQFGALSGQAESVSAIAALPEAGTSSWFANMQTPNEVSYTVPGLPANVFFDVLFGCAERVPAKR
jgi:type VI secretion system protein ImpM